jgi:hypothetical protein
MVHMTASVLSAGRGTVARGRPRWFCRIRYRHWPGSGIAIGMAGDSWDFGDEDGDLPGRVAVRAGRTFIAAEAEESREATRRRGRQVAGQVSGPPEKLVPRDLRGNDRRVQPG